MRKQNFLRIAGLLVILTLTGAMAAQTVNALVVENVKTWYWTSNTYIKLVARGDVDGDSKIEIVTGGWYNDGTRDVAQLCVWDGSTIALKNVRTWYWTGSTRIYSVAVGDVDADGKTEIVTGGHYTDGTRDVAQLCVWDGSTLALKNVKTWYWTSNTHIQSIAVGDVDGDSKIEIVTGGWYNVGGTRDVAQLCVWDGSTIALKNVQAWYWTDRTRIWWVAVGDVDGDGKTEIASGGVYVDVDIHGVAQLCVWDGATLTLKNVRTWDWGGIITEIDSVAVGDVDGDGKTEIVTGGWYTVWPRDAAGTPVAQLCVWDGATLALKNVQTWKWANETYLRTVAVGDVDADGKTEILTGGYFNDGTIDVPHWVAQLCVWDGATLALKNVQAWYWSGSTYIYSVAVGDVDADGKTEILTGGHYTDGTRDVAQLCIWA